MANTLNSFRNGAVSFIDWLDALEFRDSDLACMKIKTLPYAYNPAICGIARICFVHDLLGSGTAVFEATDHMQTTVKWMNAF